jgi:molecular chaperone GrpE
MSNESASQAKDIPVNDSADPVEGAGADAAVLDAVATAEAKAAEATEKFFRLAADFDNFKKRAAREREEALRNGVERVVLRLLPVADSFEMAMTAATSAQGTSVESLKAGVEMIQSQLKAALAEVGAVEVESLGKPFDPAVHEAVSQQETSDAPEGQVIQQLRKGYKLREKLIRPASVIVAKSPAA